MGQKQKKKGEGRRNNRTRQNNKRADRNMELNGSPEIPDSGEDFRRVASLQAKNRSLREDFESIKYR